MVARECVEGDCFIASVCDSLYPPDAVLTLLKHAPPEADTVVAGSKCFDYVEVDEATKIKLGRDGAVTAIEKGTRDFDLIDIGLFVIKSTVFNLVDKMPWGMREFNLFDLLMNAIEGSGEGVSASHAYAYTAYLYAKKAGRSVTFVNAIPTPIANDPAVVKLFEEANPVVFGDDGATGATPLTADLLKHLAERNRFVEFIVQFNIGGNTDFLALTVPERNKMKKFTKSSIVKDILGYDAPHYIKPAGYLEPLGDKEFAAMHVEYLSFNWFRDSISINARINDSPTLAGMLVDLARLGKIAVG